MQMSRMQRDCVLRIADRVHLTSLSVEYKKCNQSLFECAESFTKGRAEVDRPLRRFRRQYEQLSQFESGRIIGMMQAGWTARRVVRQLGRSDCVVRRCWDQWIREMSFTPRPGSGRPRQTSGREAATSDESRFNLSSDDNRVRVWRPRGELLHPAFALQRYTTPTAGVMVWGSIAYNIWSQLVLIRGTMTAQR
ncbi:transposable element Tcb2 transposase, partial [Trichonephila clavipes]